MFRKIMAQLLILLLLTTPITAMGAQNLHATTGPAVLPAGLEFQANFRDYDLTSSEPISVIIELKGAPLAEVGTLERQEPENALLTIQDAVLEHMEDLSIDFRLQHRYTYLLNGIVGAMPASQLELLTEVPQVLDVCPNYESFDALEESAPAIGLPEIWESLPYGYDGTGVVVGVIDSRIDWRHPAFGGGFGPGYRVIGGWDLIDNCPLEESVDLGPANRHGTHVAAIVAGAAPGASIRGYAISSPSTATNLARILSAIEMAVRDGVDVINLSNGSEYGHDDTIRNRVFDRAIDAGVVLVIANGNGGARGERTTWTYAAADRVISVGNADARVRALITHDASGTKMPAIKFAFSVGIDELDGRTYEYVHCNYGDMADLFDDDGNSLVAGKIALISRGGTPAAFRLKMENAAAAGAAAALIYNNIDEPLSSTVGSTQEGDIPGFAISLSEGQFLIGATEKTITIEKGYDFKMHASSSKGPTPLLNIKPDVAAPGHMIIAAYPYPESGVTPPSPAFQGEDGAWYVANSGTSMAAPHVAAVAAILRQAHPDWTPDQIKLALMNTATDIKQLNGESYRPIEQGAGMVNIVRAIQPNILINPGSLSFKEVVAGETTRNLELQSNCARSITYSLRVEKHNPEHAYDFDLPKTISVDAKTGAILPVILNVSEDLPASDLDNNVYCGYIYFENTADPSDTYRVPYHFVNKTVVSDMTVSPLHFSYHPDASHKEVTFSFTLGQPVNDLCFFLSGYDSKLFANTGPLPVGKHTVVWDGKFNDPDFNIADGMYSVYPHYQLEPNGPFYSVKNASYQTAPTFAYLLIDSEAPKYHAVTTRIAQEENHLEITGYIDDMINNVLHDAPMVYLNGIELETVNRADPSGPGRGYDYTYFESLIEVDLNDTIAVFLEAKDRAGNSSGREYALSPFVVDNPDTDYTDDVVYAVSGRVIPGIIVTVAGKQVEVNAEGHFATEVAVPHAANVIEVVADVPDWENFVPLKQEIRVVREESIAVDVKFTPRTFNLKNMGQWVSLEATALKDSMFTDADFENVRLLIGGETVVPAKCKVAGNKLMADFAASGIAELLAISGEHAIVLMGTMDGTSFYGMDTVRVILPGN